MDPSALLQSFVPSKARPLKARPYLVPTIYITCILGSFLPPGAIRSGSVVLTVSYIIAQIPKYSSGNIATDVLTPIQAVLQLMHWFDFYILNDPEQFSRKGKRLSETKGWWEKLKWHADLNTSMRGIGFDWEVKNVPPPAPPGTKKWQFVRAQLGEAVIWYLCFDLASAICRHSVYNSPFPPDFSEDSLPRQLLFTWLPACIGYWANVLQFTMFSALAVASGLFNPQDWRSFCGRLRDVYSVRGLWGKFWHQLLRRNINVPFQVLTRIFPIKKGTLLSRYGQLYLGFITSGILHAIAAMNIADDGTVASMWLELSYFLVQPLAITFEDIVKDLGKQWGIKESRKTRWLGRAWTFAWFSWSLRLTSFHHYQIEAYKPIHLPSVVEWVWRGRWM